MFKMTVEEKIKKIVNDPILYIESFMKVVNKDIKLVPFKLTPEQKTLMQNMSKHNIVLKSRQLGITTVACAKSIYLCMTRSYVTCLLMSYSDKTATIIFNKLKELYFNLPEALRVPYIANNAKELCFKNGSHIVVCTCGSQDNGRGSSLIYAHLSEVGLYKSENCISQLTAIDQALLPDGQMVLESTANGMNYFSEIWGKSERKENTYKPFFFNWINDKIMFEKEHKQFIKLYLDLHGKLLTEEEYDDTEKRLQKMGMSIAQAIWRRFKIADMTEEKFSQEFPATAVEAFLTTGSNIFNSNMVYERLSNADEIEKLENRPDNLPDIFKQWFNRGLTMWDIPKFNRKYYYGVDTAEGLGGDFSTIEMIDEEGEQVAEFKSNKIKPYDFAHLVNDIGIYYNNANAVVEKNAAGNIIVDKLKHDYQYPNMYKYKRYDNKGKGKREIGFVTDEKSKSLMIGSFVELFETEQLGIKSKDLLKEMKVFAFDNGKMGAIAGSNDDLVMAMAMAIQGMVTHLNYC